MGKKELKKQYKDFDINVIDLISRMDTTPTNKLLPFLMKQVAEKFSFNPKGLSLKSIERREWEEFIKPKNRLEAYIMDMITDELGGRDRLQTLHRFSEHLTAGRLENNDVSQYETWDAINWATTQADLKVVDKQLAKETKIVYSDDNWLFLKPLSFKAAQTYGNGTKWCTSMRNEPSYFYRYCKNGILIYVINKKSGEKYGFYSSLEEFSVWNAKDSRIDSMETRIPADLLMVLREEMDLLNNPTNEKLFSKEELVVRKRLIEDDEVKMMNEEVAMEAPMGHWDTMEVDPHPPVEHWDTMEVEERNTLVGGFRHFEEYTTDEPQRDGI